MQEVKIIKLNESYIRIETEYGISKELQDYFTFTIPNHNYRQPGKRIKGKFPKYKWNGQIKLIHLKDMKLLAGLIPYVEEFAKDHGYNVSISDPSLSKIIPLQSEDLQKIIDSLKLPFTPYYYQFNAVLKSLQNKRLLIVSPTASGKSLIIYLLARIMNKKTLIIVPTINLVRQLYSDFGDYSVNNGWSIENNVSKIYANQEKESSHKIKISTWQSMVNMSPEYLAQFEAIIADECLDENTKIRMADETEKMIKDIKLGDLVKTYNETTKEIENKPVLKIHENISIKEDMFEIEFENRKKFKITGNHTVLLTTGIWKRVDLLEEGDIINSI